MPGEQTLSGHFRFRKGIILGLCKLLKIRRRFLRKIQGTYFKISALYFKIYGLYFLQDALCFFQRPMSRFFLCAMCRRNIRFCGSFGACKFQKCPRFALKFAALKNRVLD
mgnify:CR=1 FL=1